tara:strand:+ start:62 stop:487 length:426 start_codon:yes stop_codon:yes gene_type:complete
MINGEYVTIAAEITNNLNTFYYIKVGTTKGYLVNRADKQRLKMVWGTKQPVEGYADSVISFENELKRLADELFGIAPIDYRPAGYTESYGEFASAQDAINAAWDLRDAFRAYTKGYRYDLAREWYVFPNAPQRSCNLQLAS